MPTGPADVTETSATPPTPVPQHADDPVVDALGVGGATPTTRADHRDSSGRSAFRSAAIVVVAVALLVVAFMLDEPISAWAYHVRVFTGIHGVRSVLNAFGHAGFTIALIAVLVIVYRAPRAGA